MANTTDKSILTAAGKALLAQLNAEEKPLIIDKMIFANVPNRPEYPQPDDVVPTDHVVHQEGVEQRGRLTADSVIYSTTLTSGVGPFEFNWTGAYCSEHGVLVTIDHHALTPKTADEPGVAGNTLVRSVVLEYKDIAEITNITVDASSWQYNATPRMKKMDEDVAQAIIDQNGKDWFIGDGFLVTPSGSAYSIKAGAGYVSGNRVAMEFDRSVQVPNKPSFIYIDAHREGTPTGEQVTLFDFVITAEEKDDYIDANGVKHFVCKIAQVLSDGSVSDLRPEGHLSERWKQGTVVTSNRVRYTYIGPEEWLNGRKYFAQFASLDNPIVMPNNPSIGNDFSLWNDPNSSAEQTTGHRIFPSNVGATAVVGDHVGEKITAIRIDGELYATSNEVEGEIESINLTNKPYTALIGGNSVYLLRRDYHHNARVVKVSQVGLLGSGDETMLYDAALQIANGKKLDLEGMSIFITSISRSVDSIKIFSSAPNACIYPFGVGKREFLQKIESTSDSSEIILRDFSIDGLNLVAKGCVIENNIAGKRLLVDNVPVKNCEQNEMTGLASGHYLKGGFKRVFYKNFDVEEINSLGGSLVASGVRAEQNGSSVSNFIKMSNIQVSGIRPGNDGDGIVVIQSYPFTKFMTCVIDQCEFENCHKRAIKTQVWKTIIRYPYIVRTEVHQVHAGNIDIDPQYGNADIIEPVFDYSSGETYPQGGVVALQGQRGEIEEWPGRGTYISGGHVKFRQSNIVVPYVFFTGTYELGDIVNDISVVGFKFDGVANYVHHIRTKASNSFNAELVSDVMHKSSVYKDIRKAFFNIGRSGVGYSFVKDASIVDVTVVKGEKLPLAELAEGNVGIYYNILERNDNIQNIYESVIQDSQGDVADNQTWSRSIQVKHNTSVKITAFYASAAGINYHAHREVIIHVGNELDENLEVLISNEPNLAGSFSFDINYIDGICNITINKPVGISNVKGTAGLIAESASGIRMV